jgi:hypothetical protein
MEAAALSTRLEWLAALVIPPAARESVLGDLCESCPTPGAFIWETFRSAPFVIFSQMRRNLNLPVILLQVGLAFWCLGPIASLAVMLMLMLMDAYQPLARPSHRQALRDALLVSFSGVILVAVLPTVLGKPWATEPRHSLSAFFFTLGAPLSLLLCGLRTALVINTDKRSQVMARAHSAEELTQLLQKFLSRARRMRLLEGAVLPVVALCWPIALAGVDGVVLAALYLSVGVYLLIGPRSDEVAGDFTTLRIRYAKDLLCHQQLRRFLWWLWASPAFIAIHSQALLQRITAGQQRVLIFDGVAAILLCFAVNSINREGSGCVQEEIRGLDRTGELSPIPAIR